MPHTARFLADISSLEAPCVSKLGDHTIDALVGDWSHVSHVEARPIDGTLRRCEVTKHHSALVDLIIHYVEYGAQRVRARVKGCDAKGLHSLRTFRGGLAA